LEYKEFELCEIAEICEFKFATDRAVIFFAAQNLTKE